MIEPTDDFIVSMTSIVPSQPLDVVRFGHVLTTLCTVRGDGATSSWACKMESYGHFQLQKGRAAGLLFLEILLQLASSYEYSTGPFFLES